MLRQHSDMYGSEDWLAEEIKRENRVSAWDIDGGRLLREEHEANCDARRLAAEHALGCDAEANAEAHRKEHSGSALDAEFKKAMKMAADRESGEMPPEDKKKILKALFGVFILMGLFPPFWLLVVPLAIVVCVLYLTNKNKQ